MSKMCRYRETVEAMIVDDALFDDPHPNPNHMTGMVFDPQARNVTLDNPFDEDERVAKVGDVVVRHAGGWDSIWPRDSFERQFVEIQPSISEVLEAVSEIVGRTFDEWWTEAEAEGAPNGFLGDVLHQIDAIKEKK